jgi:hypothetical protein
MRKSRVLVTSLFGVASFVMQPAAYAATANQQATMEASEEVPSPGPAGARGAAAIVVDDVANTVCYQLTYEGIGKPTMAHIHTGAKGVAGPVAVNLDYPKNGDKGCVQADPAVVQSIRDDPGGHYVNIHTADYPKGAMRGQLTKS